MRIYIDKIFSTKWLILLLIPLFEPTIFVKHPLLNIIYACYLCVVLVFMLMYYLIKKIRIPFLFFLMLIYRFYLLIPTIFSSGDYLKWGYLSLVMFSLILIMNISLKVNYKNFIESIVYLFSFLLTVNLLLFIIYPDGLYLDTQLHFLGIRTRFTDISFPCIIFSVFLLRESKYIMSKLINIYAILISMLNILLPKISTAIIGIALFSLLLFLFNFKEIKYFLTSKKLFLFSIIITFLVVFLRIGDLFSDIIFVLFGKTASFSGRTEIWDNAYPIILEKWYIGYGIVNDGNFVPWIDNDVRLWQAHNQLLQLLYDGGIFSSVLMLYIIYISSKKIGFCKLKYGSHIFVFGLFCLLIMMITEIYSYYPGPYLIIFMCYFFNYISIKKNVIIERSKNI